MMKSEEQQQEQQTIEVEKSEQEQQQEQQTRVKENSKQKKKVKNKKPLSQIKQFLGLVLVATFMVFYIYKPGATLQDLTIQEKDEIREEYKNNDEKLHLLKIKQRAKILGIEKIHDNLNKNLIKNYVITRLDRETDFIFKKKNMMLPKDTILIKIIAHNESFDYFILKKKFVIKKAKK